MLVLKHTCSWCYENDESSYVRYERACSAHLISGSGHSPVRRDGMTSQNNASFQPACLDAFWPCRQSRQLHHKKKDETKSHENENHHIYSNR